MYIHNKNFKLIYGILHHLTNHNFSNIYLTYFSYNIHFHDGCILVLR